MTWAGHGPLPWVTCGRVIITRSEYPTAHIPGAEFSRRHDSEPSPIRKSRRRWETLLAWVGYLAIGPKLHRSPAVIFPLRGVYALTLGFLRVGWDNNYAATIAQRKRGTYLPDRGGYRANSGRSYLSVVAPRGMPVWDKSADRGTLRSTRDNIQGCGTSHVPC